MPELPEVEVLVRHLAPLLRGRRIGEVDVLRARVVRPHCPAEFARRLRGARLVGLDRRGKFLRFRLRKSGCAFPLIGHLGMTGRMYLQPAAARPPKHAAVMLALGRHRLVFEDTRYFGRLTLDGSCLEHLGPEPMDGAVTPRTLAHAFARSRQPIKVKLLDQTLLAGVGNIYASETLFRAGVSPRTPARQLQPGQIRRLLRNLREVLAEAITFGSTVPLNWSGDAGDGLFYYGRSPGTAESYEERLEVYGRAGEPCRRCGGVIRRIVQAARSTFFCPRCQP